jgi:hypothetical protein
MNKWNDELNSAMMEIEIYVETVEGKMRDGQKKNNISSSDISKSMFIREPIW